MDVEKEGIFTKGGNDLPVTACAGKTIRIKSPFILDPLFSASGFLAHYARCDTTYPGGAFSLTVFGTEKTQIFDLDLSLNRESAEGMYLLVEKVAGFLEVLSGIPCSEVKLAREIDLFEEAVSLSHDMLAANGGKNSKNREDLLRGWWSLPTAATVLAFSGGVSLEHETGICRFAAEINLMRELDSLRRVMHSLGVKGPSFALPPICYLGEMLKCYLEISGAD